MTDPKPFVIPPDLPADVMQYERGWNACLAALAPEPATAGEPDNPAWRDISELHSNTDDLFWFMRWDGSWIVEGPREPQAGGYDADEWTHFAPCVSPPVADIEATPEEAAAAWNRRAIDAEAKDVAGETGAVADPRAFDYYRSAFLRTEPSYLPSRVRIAKTVRGDGPFARVHVRPGDYPCESNRYGALSVRTESGDLLGIKPGEFEPIDWIESAPTAVEGSNG